ncbi:hypothetical protein F0267_00460 [Vibrio coralliilyticus]|uniref:Uncharacterized protein n=2 Tax=Vibrio TaxID=662 RepID=A0AAN0W076_9VIBR|nr:MULTISPECIES: hypothetical protein [Vibrio]AIW22593.1 hypothetical protein IX92_26385 [Vibrio coralliilyticus]MCZ2802002.1 hypothetical protein [Vibrio alginolyticus]NOH36691.1 hypothetical protein [Vibrio coralliilyticus]PAW02200.1 hypothetical protein CKJ79_16190 [Vibrio coralliilyticus]POB46914.1 hypothetical protein CRN52_12605 [Vibrio vulnificus]
MRLSITAFGKSHKALVITGPKEKVNQAAEKIDGQRHHYKMDYSDFTILENGHAEAEFVVHRSHHKKAANYIRDLIR